MGELTRLLSRARVGDESALGSLYQALYAELRAIAHARLRHGGPSTLLQTTSLVNESYLRLVKVGQLDVADRTHFLAYAARAMRSIVVDFARAAEAERRGGDQKMVPLSTTVVESATIDTAQVVRVHEALEELSSVDRRLAQVVEMRFFAGLDHAEIAEILGISRRTVEREWEKARALLFVALK